VCTQIPAVLAPAIPPIILAGVHYEVKLADIDFAASFAIFRANGTGASAGVAQAET
jgi:hypothetical protein